MSVITTFENWFNSLTHADQLKLIKHISETKSQPMMEGYYTGPAGSQDFTKGMFTGPSGTIQTTKCPTCGKAL